jgi:hypothetical protein
LAATPEKIDAFINDDTTWKDVFKPKDASYLTDVVYGRAQYWDDNLKKFVRPGEAEGATQGETPTSGAVTGHDTSVASNPLMKDEPIHESNILSGDDSDDDNLPF